MSLAESIVRPCFTLRGRPLMIWGGGGNFRNEFIFSQEPLPYKFSFLGKASQKNFPGECLSRFIFPGEYLPKLFFSRFPPAPPPDH